MLTLLDIINTAAEVQGKDPAAVRVSRVPLWLARLLAWGCRQLGRAGLERARVVADGLEFAIFSCSHDSVGEAVGGRTVRQCYEQKLREEAAAAAAAAGAGDGSGAGGS